jgi:hypothetical protein
MAGVNRRGNKRSMLGENVPDHCIIPPCCLEIYAPYGFHAVLSPLNLTNLSTN